MGDWGIEVQDSAEIGLSFPARGDGTVHLDYLQRPPSHTLEINGTQGMIRWDNATGNASLYRAERDAWEEWTVPDGFERNWLFLDELRHFLKVVKGSKSAGLHAGRWRLGAAPGAGSPAVGGMTVQLRSSVSRL